MINDSTIAALGGVAASAAPGASPAQARAYTHPALPGRTVVRLTTDALAQVEDTTLASLGFTHTGTPTPVGHTRTRTTGFPEWPILTDPANARHALNLVGDLRRIEKTARAKPGNAKKGIDELARMLDESAPHFLPTFLEEAARIFLRSDNRAYATQYFGKAREAERAHSLNIDEERHRQVFLEFALAGAVSAKELSAEGKALLERYSAGVALDSFLTLNIERVKGGMPPYGGLAADVRRLAQEAGADLLGTQVHLLRQILSSPSVEQSSAAFWKQFRRALVELARSDEEAKTVVARLAPPSVAPDDWVGVLDDLGITGELVDGRLDCREWVERYTRMLQGTWRASYPRALCLLIRRMKGLAGKTVALSTGLYSLEPEILDAMLEAGARVVFDAEPPFYSFLRLDRWAASPDRPDLDFLADSDMVPLVVRGIESAMRSHLDTLIAHSGTRRMLGVWAQPRLGDEPTAAQVLAEAKRLSKLLTPVGARSFPDQLAALAAHLDGPRLLARTLRDGLVTELTWPALEAAAAESGDASPTLHESFPAVGVASNEHIVWVDGDQRVAEARFTPKAGTAPQRWEYLLVEGETAYLCRHDDGTTELTWSNNPGAQADQGYVYWWRPSWESTMLPVPGGRLVGERVVRVGDSEQPFSSVRPLLSEDGHYWRVESNHVNEVDPQTGAVGRESLPGPLADLIAPYLRDGWELQPHSVSWCPTTPTTERSLVSTAQGRHAWVTLSRDGEFLHLDADGHVCRAGSRNTMGRISRPGGGHWLVSDGALAREDGSPLLRTAGANGLAHLLHRVPRIGWHQFRVRDAAASGRLRGTTEEQAQTLLAAVSAASSANPAEPANPPQDPAEVLTDAARAAARAFLGSEDPALVDAVVWASAGVKRILLLGAVPDAAAPEAPRSFPGAEASCGALRWATGDWGRATSREVIGNAVRRLAGENAASAYAEQSLPVVLAEPLALLFSAARPLAPREFVEATAAAFGDVVDLGLYSPSCCVFDVPGLRQALPGHAPLPVVDTPDGPAVMVGRTSFNVASNASERFYSPSGGVPSAVHGIAPQVAMRGCGIDADTIIGALRTLLSDGVPEWDPEAVRRLAEGTGWSPAAAALFMAGLPGVQPFSAGPLAKDLRALLGLKAKEAREGQEFLMGLGSAALRRLVAAAAHDPVRFVREGADVDAVVEAWRREDDGSFHLPGHLLDEAGRAFRYGGRAALLGLGGSPDEQNLDAWLWAAALAHRDDPLAEWLVDAYESMKRACATTPLTWSVYDRGAALRPLLGLPPATEDPPRGRADSAGAWTLTADGYSTAITWDPAACADIQAEARLVRALPYDDGHYERIRARLDILSGVYDAVAEDLRVVRPGAPKDPLSSAPHVVADVQKALGLPQDAARYWLQILALADPTDANIHTWNTWTRKQRLKATGPLLDAGLLVQAKRARAGRTAFLPGGWQEATSPHKPMEVWKAPFYELLNTPKVTPRHHTVTPLTTLATLYEDAWHRYTTGDTPGYTELRTTPYRRR